MIPRYRAWDSVEKKFVEHFFITENGLICNMEKPTSDRKLIIPIEKSELNLMQSTGLFDKNGKEIFEGDVISTYTDNLVIKRDNLLGFYVEVDEKRNHFAETVDIEYLDLFAKDFEVAVEVLGNIYENPELLEVKE